MKKMLNDTEIFKQYKQLNISASDKDRLVTMLKRIIFKEKYQELNTVAHSSFVKEVLSWCDSMQFLNMDNLTMSQDIKHALFQYQEVKKQNEITYINLKTNLPYTYADLKNILFFLVYYHLILVKQELDYIWDIKWEFNQIYEPIIQQINYAKLKSIKGVF